MRVDDLKRYGVTGVSRNSGSVSGLPVSDSGRYNYLTRISISVFPDNYLSRLMGITKGEREHLRSSGLPESYSVTVGSEIKTDKRKGR